MQGLDYTPFPLFHPSVLWRMGVASHKQFEFASPGAHEEALWLRLVAEEPSQVNKYPFGACALVDPVTQPDE
jgi:hypothetical protein